MKVVLFCGGLGMRMRPLYSGGDADTDLPKPMVAVAGQRPLIWHVMKYYAHFGHKDFILCLGYKGEIIKDYFLNYNECLSNDFVLEQGGRKVELINHDIQDWRISFIDTGLKSNIGTRLWQVRHLLKDEDTFLANYSDGLSDLPLPHYLDAFNKSAAIAGFACVHPHVSTHRVEMAADGEVRAIQPMRSDVWINGGYFILRRQIFDYMREGEELVEEPFRRLIAEKRLFGYQHHGFWACVDTFKEKQELDDRFSRGDAPWMLWQHPQHA